MSIGRIVTYALAVIGASAICGATYFAALGFELLGGSDGVYDLKESVSSDGIFRATSAVNSGGGAASWCHEYITVRPSNAPRQVRSFEDSRDETVFDSNCTADFSMSWVSARELVIHFNIPSGRTETSGSIKTIDKTGKVAIKYVVGTKAQASQ